LVEITPSRLERVLRVFTNVRGGEGVTALLMFANVFLLLTSYYFVKPLRDGWIAVSSVEGLSKMEVKAYSSFGQSVLFIAAIWAYSKLASRLPRATLIARETQVLIQQAVGRLPEMDCPGPPGAASRAVRSPWC
jgi:AAA family ATP:ADP antiporter